MNKSHDTLPLAKNEDFDEKPHNSSSLSKDRAHGLLPSAKMTSGESALPQELTHLGITSQLIIEEGGPKQSGNMEDKDIIITDDVSNLGALSGPIRSTPSNGLSIIIEDEEAEWSRKSIKQSLPSIIKSSEQESDHDKEAPETHLLVTGGKENMKKSSSRSLESSESKVVSVSDSQSNESMLIDSSSTSTLKTAVSGIVDSVSFPPPLPFPIIGAPSPLRASVRAPLDPSSVTAANNKGSMRSSWLVKAREAKALEETTKRYHNISIEKDLSVSLKRKSEEVFDHEDEVHYFGSEDRKIKMSKANADSAAQNYSHFASQFESGSRTGQVDVLMGDEHMRELVEDPEGMIGRLKKTVDGLNAKAGKSLNRSLGGAAATALAEAKAAAEAKVAEKNATEGRLQTAIQTQTSQEPLVHKEAAMEVFAKPQLGTMTEKRLSVSDLISTFEGKHSGQEHTKVALQPLLPHARGKENDASIVSTTTPPISPPKSRSQVFSAPKDTGASSKQPVFRAPETKQAPANNSLKPLSTNKSLLSQSSFASTQQSSQPESLFEHESWQKQTQETDYNDIGFSQSDEKPNYANADHDVDMDIDDSWHADDEHVTNQLWDNTNYAEDDTTWSTNPTRSQKGYTTSNRDNHTRDIQDVREEKDLVQSDTQSVVFEVRN